MQDGEKSPKTKGPDLGTETAGGKGWSLSVRILFFLAMRTQRYEVEGEYPDTCHEQSIGNAMEDSRCEIQCLKCSMLPMQSTDFTNSRRRYARRCEGSAMANPLLQDVEK